MNVIGDLPKVVRLGHSKTLLSVFMWFIDPCFVSYGAKTYSNNPFLLIFGLDVNKNRPNEMKTDVNTNEIS